MAHFKKLLPIALAALLVPVVSADVFNVRGPQADFDQIQAAVVAAEDGDIVRIWPGTYQAFWIDDESLTLVAADPGGGVSVHGTYRIMNLAAHRSVLISGVSATGADGIAMVVSDCLGSVRFRDSHFVGGSAGAGYPWNGFSGSLIQNCVDVSMVDCSSTGGNPAYGEFAGWGGTGLEAWSSRVSLFASEFTGVDGSVEDDPGASGWSGGHGVDASGGRVYLSGCTLRGGNGAPADWDMSWWTGQYGYGGSGGWGFYGSGGVEAWFLDNTFVPGQGGWSPDPGNVGYPGQDKTSGVDLNGPARLMRTSRLTDDQQGILLEFSGLPGEPVYLKSARSPGYRFRPDFGPQLVSDPSPHSLVPSTFIGHLDGTGNLQRSLRLRELVPFGVHTLHVQGRFGGSARFESSPGWTVILDAAW